MALYVARYRRDWRLQYASVPIGPLCKRSVRRKSHQRNFAPGVNDLDAVRLQEADTVRLSLCWQPAQLGEPTDCDRLEPQSLPQIAYAPWITASPTMTEGSLPSTGSWCTRRRPQRFPSPVRAMGSYHSLTPCASSDGTIVNMSAMKRVREIDPHAMTFTAQAGLQFIEASRALRAQNLQFMTNIEIGNMTLGSAACCHTKDALDGIEHGQVSSYVTGIRWVSPSGELEEASEDSNPGLLRLMRSSYGLSGIVYEVTFRIKRLEAARLTYLPRSIDRLTEAEVAGIIAASEGLICWTLGRTAIFQTKKRIAQPGPLTSIMAAARHVMWNHVGTFGGRAIDTCAPRNQSPLVTRQQVEAAYGARRRQFSDWVRTVDPGQRMLNPFFRDLLS
jgi:hypothetical protein